MKKFIFVALFVLALILVVTPAFALTCKNGNYGSDECWTNVKVSPLETQPVSIGSVLIYDASAGPLTADDGGAFQVRVLAANNSYDGVLVAGIAQKVIATGDYGQVLVRGRGKVRCTTTTSSGDRLYVAIDSKQRGALGVRTDTAVDRPTSYDKSIAFALEAGSVAILGHTAATIDAYVTVV